MNTTIRRAWLQTAGLPIDEIHADLRAEFDQVHRVEYIGGACFKLQDSDGVQVGLVQFQAHAQARVDRAVAATTDRLATGEAKPVDLLAGDTLIRPLDLNDPLDRAMAENAIGRADSSVIIPDIERADPPPIDLPDYEGDDAQPERRVAYRRRGDASELNRLRHRAAMWRWLIALGTVGWIVLGFAILRSQGKL